MGAARAARRASAVAPRRPADGDRPRRRPARRAGRARRRDPEALGRRGPDAPADACSPSASLAARRRARDPPVRARRAAGRAAGVHRARGAATCVVAAPGGRVVDGDWPASALVVELQRAEPRRARGGRAAAAAGRAAARLPRRQGVRAVLRGRARASTSRSSTSPGASARTSSPSTRTSSSAGVERGLDPQVTRTLMGTAYPTVGLHSKYYDADMDPLCQVVQDTVGPPRLVRARLHRALLRGPGLPRPRQLHGELQPPARPVRDRRRARAGRR